jgi:hypothetical protein
MGEPAQTVEQFLAALPQERRAAAVALRDTILTALPAGFEERLQYGMLAYGVPWRDGPAAGDGIGGAGMLSLVSVADHWPYMALYVNCVEPGGEEAFYARWRATGTPLETGSRAVRFRNLDELALGVVAEFVAAATPEALRTAYARAAAR